MLTSRYNQDVDEKPAQRGRDINHESVHQKFAQVTSYRFRRGRVGSTEVDEKYASHRYARLRRAQDSPVRTPPACSRFAVSTPEACVPLRNYCGTFQNLCQANPPKIVAYEPNVFGRRR